MGLGVTNDVSHLGVDFWLFRGFCIICQAESQEFCTMGTGNACMWWEKQQIGFTVRTETSAACIHVACGA